MKQSETDWKNVAMILSFLYSGISLIACIIFLIGYINEGSIPIFGRIPIQQSTILSLIKTVAGFVSIITGAGALISFLSGWVLMKTSHSTIVHKVEEKKEEEKKKEIDSDILMPDEKTLIKILKEHEGSMTQKELVAESGLSKVKVHRVLKRLEAKKVVSKYEFGMTNRIRLEKELKE